MANMDTVVVVPGRLASQRFPRKLLHAIAGKPLIQWTAERIQEQVPELPLFFAVAETELADVLQALGFQTVLTDPDLPSGTDRVCAANTEIGASVVVNVQADEPMVTRAQILGACDGVRVTGFEMATVARPFPDLESLTNPNHVKVLCSASCAALYFSRAPLPFARDSGGALTFEQLEGLPCYWHQGIYAYQANTLRALTALPVHPLESIEKLEQLRALANGLRVGVSLTEDAAFGVDTPDDAARLESLLTHG